MRGHKSAHRDKTADLVDEYEKIISGYETLLSDQEETFVVLLKKHKACHERLTKEVAELKSENNRLRKEVDKRNSSIGTSTWVYIAWFSAVIGLIAWPAISQFYSDDFATQNMTLTDTIYFQRENLDFFELEVEDDNDDGTEDLTDDQGQLWITKLLSLKLLLTFLALLPVLWVILCIHYLQKLRKLLHPTTATVLGFK